MKAKGLARTARWLLFCGLLGFLVMRYLWLEPSEKTYLKNIARQLRYMPARYAV
jgi:hypothetical protein